ncbi:MAG: DUF4142 domain-containing protein [Chthoniobacteraceae bacterium]|nr:DUF4142 domain-containing protein [Chthoniobacteraceae bacterium]
MKRIFSFTILAALALMTPGLYAAESAAPAASPAIQHGNLDRKDHEFLKKAAEINLTEIELGKIAERVSTDPNIKKIAGTIIKDHMVANQKLERLAASKGASIPLEPSIWDRHTLNMLQKEQGVKFNQEFLSFNVKGHEKAVALFEKESLRIQDPDIKAWAQKTLPELKQHLAMAKSGKPEAVAEKLKEQKQQKQQPMQH